jgi:hypothetical protein
MSKSIEDVRTHLFAVLDGLANTEKPMELDRAKAICEAAQTIINSAKVEVDYLKVTGRNQSAFLGSDDDSSAPPKLPRASGSNGSYIHRLKG